MSHRKSLDEKIADLLEQKKEAETDLKKKDKEKEDAEATVDESDAKHKRAADKDQKEKEELSKVKQESVDKKDDEEEDDEEEMKDTSEQKDVDAEDDAEDDDDEEEMKESDAKHGRKADKEQREKADKLEKAKGQDSTKEVDSDNKKAFDYIQKKPNFSVSEDIEALFNGEQLSEEFKTKATTILEAAVNRQLDKALEKIQEDIKERLDEQAEVQNKVLVEQVSKYLDYVVENWMEENKLAIERGYAIETTQDFISGLKGLFQEHYVEVPDVPKNVLDDMQDKNDTLEKDLNEALNRIIDLKGKNEEKVKDKVFHEVTSQLADTQVDKFRELSESVEFSEAEDYRGRLNTIKTNYFPTGNKNVAEIGDSVDGGFDEKAPSPQVKAYADAITRSLNHKKT